MFLRMGYLGILLETEFESSPSLKRLQKKPVTNRISL